jgi:hypothetical protein
MPENAVGYEDKQIKATSGKSHADLANNIFRIARSLDILMVKTNTLIFSLPVLLLPTVIISCMFLLFLGHHQGDNIQETYKTFM